jgi:hypothetical protein
VLGSVVALVGPCCTRHASCTAMVVPSC